MPTEPQNARRIGVFGGTFDPPHLGHLAVAVNVRHALRLDEVLLMVANHPWQKDGVRAVSPPEDRFALVCAAVAQVDGLAASSLEIELGGPSFTANTLAALHERNSNAQYFTIVGADAANGFDSWERCDEVAALSTLVVVDRPGVVTHPPQPKTGSWVHVEVPHLEVSSSDLRARVADGRPLDFLVPLSVAHEIERRQLYRVAGS